MLSDVSQGIVPTLIIVRVGLGISTEDVETSVATFQASETARDIDTLGSTVLEGATVLDIRRGNNRSPEPSVLSSEVEGSIKAEITRAV